jgi:NYN domain
VSATSATRGRQPGWGLPRSSNTEKSLSLSRASGTTCRLPSATNGLAVLQGRQALVLLDGENISYSLKPNADCDYRRLAALVRSQCPAAHLHAFASAPPGPPMDYARTYFAQAGWLHHLVPIEVVRDASGVRKRANSDAQIHLHGAKLIATCAPDYVVLISGDGDLGCDLARFLSAEAPQAHFMTLGLPHSFSHRLRVEQNNQVSCNAWLGADVVVGLPHRH